MIFFSQTFVKKYYFLVIKFFKYHLLYQYIIDTNEIKVYLKSSGHEDSKNIFSFIIKCTGQSIQPPKIMRFFGLWGPLIRKLSKSETNGRLNLFYLDETNRMVYRKNPKSITPDIKEYPKSFQIFEEISNNFF